MKRSTLFIFLFLFMIVPVWTFGWAAWSWAHSGHDHGVEPSISLPEVLAKVNGEDIPKSAIWDDLTQTVKRYKDRGLTLTREQEKTAAKKLLQDRINRKLLLKKGGELGLSVSDAKFQEELGAVKKNFSSEKDFQEELKQRGLSMEKYQQELKDDILVDMVFRQELGKGVTISDPEVEAYYNKNTSEFSSPEQRRASVILIKVNPKAGSKGDKEARKSLQKIIDKLKSGSDFEEMARLHSQDSLAKRGGDLGFFTKDRMFGPFADLAFKLEVGQVSEIFRTKHGYQILKVTGKKEARQGTLESEKENIRNRLRDQAIQNKSHGYLEDLRKQAEIKIYF